MNHSFKLEKRKIPVFVVLKGENKEFTCRFMLDTGAGVSLVNTSILPIIGYSSKDRTKTESYLGFGGKWTDVSFLKVKSMKCLDLKRNNFEIGYHDFGYSFSYDGILGVDFLLNHKLVVDFKNEQLSLE